MVPKRCRVIRARALRVHLEVRGSRRRGVVIWRRVFQKLGFLSTVKRRSRGGKNSMAKMSVAWRIASGSSMQQRTTSGEDDVEIPGDRVPGYLHEIANPLAVKQLFIKNQQSITEFVNEVVVVTAIKHRNLINLKGCCIREGQRLLVYEYVDNNELTHHLFRMESKKNMHARAALNQRRELRSEVSQRRELEILEQAEQERLRQFRSAQEREHHRTWRSRSRSDEVEGGIDQASGEGSAGAQEEDNPNGDEPKNDGCEVCDKFEENGGGESSGEEESLESNVVLT